jgi:HEAT repeat protein
VTKVVYIILAEVAALPLLITAQRTDQQELEQFLRKPAGEVAREYFEHPPYQLFVIRRLIELGDPVVIPVLHRAFADETAITKRQFIAAALVSLGDLDPQYFEYIEQAARVAIGSELPFPVLLKRGNGSTTAKLIYRPEFVRYIQEHGLDLTVALREATSELPGSVEALGEAADPRSSSILLHGLDSPNAMIVRAAAFGLARLHENSGIQPIIAACLRFPREERRIIAKALLYFESTSAERAAKKIIADQQLIQRWQVEAKRRGWKGAMRDSGR